MTQFIVKIILNATIVVWEKKIYTFGDRQASIIKFVFLLIRSEKSKIHLRSSS